MSEEGIRSEQQALSDQPITTRQQNQLGRGREEMSKRLARSIGNSGMGSGIVVGLCGRFGDGKTSMKNLVVEAFTEIDGAPEVMEFVPWQFGGSEATVAAFFEDLSAVIGRRSGQKDKTAAAALKKYGGLLSLGGILAKAAGAFRLSQGGADGATLIALGHAAETSSKATEAGAKAEEGAAESRNLSVQEVKKELAALLDKIDQRLLIVVDDIDRLGAEEIRSLFKLVKANADFPNVTYLLLFQRDIVELALDDSARGIDGREFLKKIVPVLYDLPPIDPDALQRLLFKELDLLWNSHGIEQTTNDGRWLNLWDGMQPLFRNLRDVGIFLNGYRFALDGFVGEHGCDVNPPDLAALEAIRQFAPEVYTKIHSAGEFLAPISPYYSEKKLEQDKSFRDRFVELAPDRFKQKVGVLLGRLFPYIAHVFGQDELKDEGQWYLERRICHPTMFALFFAMSLGDDAVSPAQVECIALGTNLAADILIELEELGARGLLVQAIKGLRAFGGKILSERVGDLSLALSDIVDKEPNREGSSRDRCTSQAIGLVRDLFDREPPERSVTLYDSLANATAGLVLPLGLASYLGKNTESRLTAAQAEEIRGIARAKVAGAAQDGRLAESIHLVNILYRWRDVGGEVDVRAYTDKNTSEKRFMFAFLRSAVSWESTVSDGDAFARSEPRIRVDSLASLIDVTKFNESLLAFEVTDLTVEERELRDLWIVGYNAQGIQEDILNKMI